MRIVVIGSTGGTGLEVVKQGIKRGHSITALARHPEMLNGIQGIESVVKGDALNPADVRKALHGNEAVISVLGIPAAASNILFAMKREGIRRGVWVSAYPVAAKKPRLMLAIVRLIFGRLYKNLSSTERILKESDLDWTIVRPPMLTNGKKTAGARIERRDDLPSGPYSISRADLASVLLDEIESGNDKQRAIVVTAPPKAPSKAVTARTNAPNQSSN